jgi:transposase InsO family protein
MSRSGYYSWRSRKPSTNTVENNSLAINISDIHDERLYTYGSPRMHVELFHSDQGSQYKAKGYQQRLRDLKITCSMSRKGECHDNAVAESFFHGLKTELVCEPVYQNRSVARQEIFKYIEVFYNRKRRHSTLNYKSPLDFEMLNVA